jgi:hypothetical protein
LIFINLIYLSLGSRINNQCCYDATNAEIPNPYYSQSQAVKGIAMFVISDAEEVGDAAEGITDDYWAAVDVKIANTTARLAKRSGDCLAIDGQELLQPDNIHWGDLPSHWAFSTPILSTLTSCTYTNTAPSEPTTTGSLKCPGLAFPVPCPPDTGSSVEFCGTLANPFRVPIVSGINFDGDLVNSQLLATCLWEE